MPSSRCKVCHHNIDVIVVRHFTRPVYPCKAKVLKRIMQVDNLDWGCFVVANCRLRLGRPTSEVFVLRLGVLTYVRRI